ncbi:MAG TPA: hypothetical protein VM370_02860 [Candidatus Thermoplasmatota archaeon]|nr:hypothetical protein [Candidatus Thermoplasmatota archaeon]
MLARKLWIMTMVALVLLTVAPSGNALPLPCAVDLNDPLWCLGL